MLRIGETIDRYTVEALIGQGGMAAVYRAKHNSLDSLHAVKILFITAPTIRRRLMQEGKVQANLRHPNIVAVTDVLEIQGAPALVMEYVDGPALDQWLKQNTPTLDESLYLFRGILRGVMEAHERGVIHRDLKPANVMLAPTNEGLVPKVTDFGLVKSLSDQRGKTETGMAMGTPEYMAPEQIRDASDVDQRVDMFALGCILYELVCHQRAFDGPDNVAVFNAIVEGKYPPPRKFNDSLPRNILMAIRWLLETNREKRLSSCMELFDLLFEDRTVGRVDAPNAIRPIHISTIKEQPVILDAHDTFITEAASSPQAAIDTVPPAKSRIATPSPVGNTPSPFTPERPAVGVLRTVLVLVPVLAVLVVGVLMGKGGVFGNPRTLSAPASTPLLKGSVSVEAPTLAVPTPVVTPAPITTVVPRPASAPPNPVNVAPPNPVNVAPPSPVNVAPPNPVNVAPPSPVNVAPPSPVNEPNPENAGVRVTFTGSAALVLESEGTRFEMPGTAPAGTYTILADFGDGLVPAGQVTLRDGADAVIACESFFVQCTQRG
jgi:eukaryotic-like serine/threonine-protein kinase